MFFIITFMFFVATGLISDSHTYVLVEAPVAYQKIEDYEQRLDGFCNEPDIYDALYLLKQYRLDGAGFSYTEGLLKNIIDTDCKDLTAIDDFCLLSGR